MIDIQQFEHALIELFTEINELTAEAQTAGLKIAEKLKRNERPINKNLLSNEYLAEGSLPVVEQLEDCEATIEALSPARKTLAQYILQMQKKLRWYQRTLEDNLAFMAGHANAQLIGPQGLYISSEIIVGVSLIAPHITYPDHNHPPEEIYIVLSEGLWWQQGGQWFSPGVQGYVYNPENIMHAMASTAKPLLAIWCLNI